MPAAPFSLYVHPADRGVIVVEVSGEIDVASAPLFEEGLAGAVRDQTSDGIVVDLTYVTFMDSTALNALVNGFERQRRGDGPLAVVASDARIRTIFEIAKLDQVLRLYDSRDDAFAFVALSTEAAATPG